MGTESQGAIRVRRDAVLFDRDSGRKDTWDTLELVYAQCLWLGEAHTPLSVFVETLQSLECSARAVVRLVRSPSEIRDRFPNWAKHMVESLKGHEVALTGSCEVLAIRTAITYGPLARVCTDPNAVNQYIRAVGCREIQLQLVIVAWLLSRRHLGDPSLWIEPHTQGSNFSARKRKKSTPMRWTGVTPPLARSFAWNSSGKQGKAASVPSIPMQRKRANSQPKFSTDPLGTSYTQSDRMIDDQDGNSSSQVQLQTMGDSEISVNEAQREFHSNTLRKNQQDLDRQGTETSGEVVGKDVFSNTIDKLSELWDQLGDYLCLLECAPMTQTQAMFGSASRIQGANDTLDEAQWVCSKVLEKAFGETLPNECARLHDKCFGPEPISAILTSPRGNQSIETMRAFQRTKSAPLQAAPRPNLAQQDETRTTIRADRRQREVHMPRQFKRSASIASTASSTTVSLHKRKRPASRWEGGSDAQTLVLATPTKPRAASIPTKLEQFTPSPPSSIVHDSSTRTPPSPSIQRSPELTKKFIDSSLELFKSEPSFTEQQKSSLGLNSDAGLEKLQGNSQIESKIDAPTQRQLLWPNELLDDPQEKVQLQTRSVGGLRSRVSTDHAERSNPWHSDSDPSPMCPSLSDSEEELKMPLSRKVSFVATSLPYL